MNADLFVAAFAKLLKDLQKLFHTYENLFSTKRKTFFNEVKIFFQCSVYIFMHFSHFEKEINLRFRSA
jgi:hypothetical protein